VRARQVVCQIAPNGSMSSRREATNRPNVADCPSMQGGLSQNDSDRSSKFTLTRTPAFTSLTVQSKLRHLCSTSGSEGPVLTTGKGPDPRPRSADPASSDADCRCAMRAARPLNTADEDTVR
jgi:hypothetical protein